MRKEYDFSKAERGRYAGRSINVIGPTSEANSVAAKLASRIEKAIERDVKNRERFEDVWQQLNQKERAELRASWLEMIESVLNSR